MLRIVSENEPTPTAIGQRIKEAIAERRITPTQAAASIGVSTSTFHRFMKGSAVLDYIQAWRLAQLVDKPLEWFMEDAA